MSSAVQFYGIEQVMSAAKNRKCPYWGIWCQRQFLFKNEENDMPASLALLDEILDNLQISTATYTLKFFDPEGNKPVRIKEDSKCDGSFNFKLIPEEERQQNKLIYQSNSPKVLELLEKMDARLAALEAPIDDDDDEPETLQGTIIGLLKEPDKLQQFIDIGKGLLGLQVTPAPRYVGNVSVSRMGQNPDRSEIQEPGPAGDLSQLSEEDFLIRCGNALDILKTNDPKILLHLEKLAKMSVDKPTQFSSLIQMLEIMP